MNTQMLSIGLGIFGPLGLLTLLIMAGIVTHHYWGMPHWKSSLAHAQSTPQTDLCHCQSLLPCHGWKLWHYSGGMGTYLSHHCLQNWDMVDTHRYQSEIMTRSD